MNRLPSEREREREHAELLMRALRRGFTEELLSRLFVLCAEEGTATDFAQFLRQVSDGKFDFLLLDSQSGQSLS